MIRGLKQKELTTISKLTNEAIRNYELGNKSPNKKQLQMIADALDCDISALIDLDLISNFEFYQIIFDYEKELKLRPLIEAESISLTSNGTELNNFLIEWN